MKLHMHTVADICTVLDLYVKELQMLLTSTENFTEIIPGEPLRRGRGKRKKGSQI